MSDNTTKPTLCLDFDGVLHSYKSGWIDHAIIIPDDPVPGMADFLLEASKNFEICVYSSRSHQEGGIAAMQMWLLNWLVKELTKDVAWPLYKLIKFPRHKPSAFVTLDDRALTFRGKWPTMETLLAFKPWNR